MRPLQVKVNEDGLSKKFNSVELLRFLAAMAVVFVHIPTVQVGIFGVDVFFIISGFVMMLSTDKSYDSFFLKRLIRVAPAYYFFTIVVFAIAVVAPTLLNNTKPNAEYLIKSLFFIPFDKNGAGHYPILFLGWTLNYEMYFYAVFGIAIAISWKGRALICAILLSLVYLVASTANSLPFSAYASNIVFEFVLGIMVYLIVVKRDLRQCFLLILVVLAALFMVNDYRGRLFDFGLPSALFVLISIYLLELRELPRIFAVLGGYSYSLYLTHPYIIQFFDKVTGWFSMDATHKTFALVLCLVLVNGVAYIFHKYVEIPVTKYLRLKIIGNRREATATR